ncbi:uncharacterized protein LOC111704584 [Eurytemora carolleeae]|uniref:uncharacterized protein LOC111704584 n=1 Tax=Eurytemora carolleeae TaxID=1294199 RepID=UPI000C772BAC|nr:uncharacterized protein LOC111704584 [Eurytemora carolleeae]|eukprot:XP_023332635.1 uncharacterized protein LOC111704584 [Eurytemora affinis]
MTPLLFVSCLPTFCLAVIVFFSDNMVQLGQFLLQRISKHTNPFFGKETPSYDRFWRRRAVLLQTSHFMGRLRNCYKLAERYNKRALTYVTTGRKYRKQDYKDLWDMRIEGACRELNYNSWFMQESLARTGVHLDRKILANMAFTEPRTFRAVTAIAAEKSMEEPEDGGLGLRPCGPKIDVFSKL